MSSTPLAGPRETLLNTSRILSLRLSVNDQTFDGVNLLTKLIPKVSLQLGSAEVRTGNAWKGELAHVCKKYDDQGQRTGYDAVVDRSYAEKGDLS